MLRTSYIFLLVCALAWAAPAGADEAIPQPGAPASENAIPQPVTPLDAPLSAREIIRRMENINDSDDEKSTMDMTLTNRRGQTRVRKMVSWSRQTGGDNQNQLVRFEEPKDIKGVGLLTWEHDERDDDQWLFLPALRKTRRISSADQADSFMGTDFSYEDMRSEELDEREYKLLREEVVDGKQCWVIESTPATAEEKKESGYSKTIRWIDQATYLLVKGEFYDKRKGALLKVLETGDFQEVQPGMWRINRMHMKNVQKNHQTSLVWTGREVNLGLKDSIFTERELKRGR